MARPPCSSCPRGARLLENELGRDTGWPLPAALLAAVPIGGFTGTIPSPTLSQLQAGIRAGQFHLVLANSTADPRIAWIAAHCQNVTKPGDTLKSYLCLPASAGG